MKAEKNPVVRLRDRNLRNFLDFLKFSFKFSVGWKVVLSSSAQGAFRPRRYLISGMTSRPLLVVLLLRNYTYFSTERMIAVRMIRETIRPPQNKFYPGAFRPHDGLLPFSTSITSVLAGVISQKSAETKHGDEDSSARAPGFLI